MIDSFLLIPDADYLPLYRMVLNLACVCCSVLLPAGAGAAACYLLLLLAAAACYCLLLLATLAAARCSGNCM